MSNKSGKSILCLCFAFVLVIAMLGSCFMAINTSFDKMPCISWVISLDDDLDEDFDELFNETKYYASHFRATLNLEKSSYTDEEYKLLDRFVTCTEECAENFSLLNAKKLIKATRAITENKDLLISDSPYVDTYDIDTLDELDELEKIFDICLGVIIGAMIFALLFSALGAFLKLRALVIIGSIFALIYSLLFCPIWVVLLLFVLHVLMVVFISMAKNE